MTTPEGSQNKNSLKEDLDLALIEKILDALVEEQKSQVPLGNLRV